MLKTLLIGFILGTTVLVADTTLGTQISEGIKSHKVKKHKKITKKRNYKKFKKDHHRYDKRYRNFDYDERGYYNNDGFYFGFYDRRGYFFNNIYFEYNSRYRYRDRVYVRGEFAPNHHHYRTYRYHRDNDWNRVHCYREPDVIVRGHYYEERYYPADRGYYRDNRRSNYREYQRDEYRRDNHYRDNSYYYRDSYNRDYQRDDARVRNHRFSDEDSSHRRSSTHRRNNASIRNHRFSDKKESKSSGRLQITK
jgi:hypothetical protein